MGPYCPSCRSWKPEDLTFLGVQTPQHVGMIGPMPTLPEGAVNQGIVLVDYVRLAELLGLPKGTLVLCVEDDFARNRFKVKVGHPDLPQVMPGASVAEVIPQVVSSWPK
jgi:hypothetical protein